MPDALGGVNPIACQHLLVKSHLRKRWVTVSSFYRIQFSHVYKSNSIFFVLSIVVLVVLLLYVCMLSEMKTCGSPICMSICHVRPIAVDLALLSREAAID
jgi:hypothetical protein